MASQDKARGEDADIKPVSPYLRRPITHGKSINQRINIDRICKFHSLEENGSALPTVESLRVNRPDRGSTTSATNTSATSTSAASTSAAGQQDDNDVEDRHRRSCRQRKKKRAFSPELQDSVKSPKRKKGRGPHCSQPEVPRSTDKLANGDQFICDLCGSPYICTKGRKGQRRHGSKVKPSSRFKVDPATGNLLQLCNACGLSFSRRNKPKRAKVVASAEEKMNYLQEAKEFGKKLALELNDSDAANLYCPQFHRQACCGCLQRFIQEGTITSPSRAQHLLSIHKQAEKLKKKKCYSLGDATVATAAELKKIRGRGIGYGNGHKRSKEYESYVMQIRKYLKDQVKLCERAIQRVLSYSNNFLHKKLKTEDDQYRVVRQKGKGVLGQLEQIESLHNIQCCGNNCTAIAFTHAKLLQQWRDRSSSGQAEARRVLAEMLTPSGGGITNCYKFIKLITGCSVSTINRVSDQMRRTGGEREPAEHGMKRLAKDASKKKNVPIPDDTPGVAGDDLSLSTNEGQQTSTGDVAYLSSSQQSQAVIEPPNQDILTNSIEAHRTMIASLQKQVAEQQLQLEMQQSLIDQQLSQSETAEPIGAAAAFMPPSVHLLQQLLHQSKPVMTDVPSTDPQLAPVQAVCIQEEAVTANGDCHQVAIVQANDGQKESHTPELDRQFSGISEEDSMQSVAAHETLMAQIPNEAGLNQIQIPLQILELGREPDLNPASTMMSIQFFNTASVSMASMGNSQMIQLVPIATSTYADSSHPASITESLSAPILVSNVPADVNGNQEVLMDSGLPNCQTGDSGLPNSQTGDSGLPNSQTGDSGLPNSQTGDSPRILIEAASKTGVTRTLTSPPPERPELPTSLPSQSGIRLSSGPASTAIIGKPQKQTAEYREMLLELLKTHMNDAVKENDITRPENLPQDSTGAGSQSSEEVHIVDISKVENSGDPSVNTGIIYILDQGSLDNSGAVSLGPIGLSPDKSLVAGSLNQHMMQLQQVTGNQPSLTLVPTPGNTCSVVQDAMEDPASDLTIPTIQPITARSTEVKTTPLDTASDLVSKSGKASCHPLKLLSGSGPTHNLQTKSLPGPSKLSKAQEISLDPTTCHIKSPSIVETNSGMIGLSSSGPGAESHIQVINLSDSQWRSLGNQATRQLQCILPDNHVRSISSDMWPSPGVLDEAVTGGEMVGTTLPSSDTVSQAGDTVRIDTTEMTPGLRGQPVKGANSSSSDENSEPCEQIIDITEMAMGCWGQAITSTHSNSNVLQLTNTTATHSDLIHIPNSISSGSGNGFVHLLSSQSVECGAPTVDSNDLLDGGSTQGSDSGLTSAPDGMTVCSSILTELNPDEASFTSVPQESNLI